MTTRSEPNLPPVLPARACEDRDLLRDYVGEGREYRGNNGSCMNCDAEYHESEDSDLATAHWMHTRAVEYALWERDTPAETRDLCRAMDPEDPMSATEHAGRLAPALAATEAARTDAETRAEAAEAKIAAVAAALMTAGVDGTYTLAPGWMVRDAIIAKINVALALDHGADQ